MKNQNMQQFHRRLQVRDKDPLFTALRRLANVKRAKTFTESDEPTPLGNWAGWPG